MVRYNGVPLRLVGELQWTWSSPVIVTYNSLHGFTHYVCCNRVEVVQGLGSLHFWHRCYCGLLFPEAGEVQLLSKTGRAVFKALVVPSGPGAQGPVWLMCERQQECTVANLDTVLQPLYLCPNRWGEIN